MKNQKVKAADYAKAWFRLQNEDTNQTLDYSYINEVKTAEGFEEEEGGDDDAGDADVADDNSEE